MYIVSIKIDKTKIFAGLATLCVAIAVVCALIPQSSADVLSSTIDNTVKTTQDHVDFLRVYGYNVNENPIRIQEIVIPDNFGEEYLKYNEYQKLSGFDLTKFKNSRVKQYTYKVNNYNDPDDEVVANILVYNDKVIGGDISSTIYGGFTHGFVKE